MRAAALLLALPALAPVLQATLVAPPSFAGLNDVPVWAVGTVEQVISVGPVPAAQRRFPWEERAYEAHLLVHRVFFRGADRPFEAGARITIHYTNPEKSAGGGGTSFGAPVILDLHPGQTFLFPLIRNHGVWTLQSDPSVDRVVPALAAETGFAGPPATGSGFVFRELANVFANSDARGRSEAASYLARFTDDVPDELPRLLALALGSNDDAWLEAGCAFLGVMGIPRNPELVYGEASPPFHDARHLVTWILWKGDRRDYPNRLIRCMLRNEAAYPWGAAVTLIDFKDSTVLIDGLNAAMRHNQPGSMMVACYIVNTGQRAVLPDALELAQKLVNGPNGAGLDLTSAAQLIVEKGDDRQFGSLVALLARLKHEDEKRYQALWSAAGYVQNPRALRLAAVLIDDRRPGFSTLRYCDAAAGVVQMISGVKLGIAQQMSPEERDRATARAAGWLKAHGVTP
jgi:hypothetical protein